MKKINVIICVISLICFASCGYKYYCNRWMTLEKNRYVYPYRDDLYSKNKYNTWAFFDHGFIVDTIRFFNPVVIAYYDYCFICEDSVIKSDDNIIMKYLDSDIYSYDFNCVESLPFKELMLASNEEGRTLVKDTIKKGQTEYVTFYKFKKDPDYFLLVLNPMYKSMNLMTIYEREDMNYRKMYKAYKKVSKPKVINGAYMRHIICVWKNEKTDEIEKNTKDENK